MADRDDGHGQEDRAENMEEEVEGDIGRGGAEGGAGGGGRGQEVEAIEEDVARGGHGPPPQGQGAPPLLVMDEEELPQELVLMEEVEIEEISDEDSWAQYESCEESDGGNGSGGEDNGEQFDATLPSRHVYLGETQELRGRTVQDENDYVTIPLLLHNSLMNLVLIPTQTLPMTIFHPLHVSMLRNVIAKDRTFGIVHTKLNQDGNSEMARYGTTAEIYEYQEEELTGALTIKAKGRQRFRVMSTRQETSGLIVARVKILPEIRMECPFEMVRLRSLDKLTLPRPQEDKPYVAHSRELVTVRTANSWLVRGRNAWLTPWPSWVYNQYDDLLLAQRLVNEIKKTTMIQPNLLKLPRDPQELSHWAAINLPLDDSHRLTLLGLNTPTQRLRYILSVISKCKMLICVRCNEVIGDTADIFSMSVEGPQGTFVNPGGYVHEMLTLTKATNLTYNGRPSIQHSWFPGYAWTIANCSSCHSHMGWKFKATNRKLKPQKFFGLTRKAVRAKLFWEGDEGGNEMCDMGITSG
ncbi:protein cereblon-like isoform X1 [Penaeus chinensis]|uniref:protein cereblon-like isoform X1 n=1 Tax=Penaeus chinensis TaxID=139456 RepID=UPI001FB69FD0|nr:protein cereblon-like isoform X1 [Penaeus chinensis]